MNETTESYCINSVIAFLPFVEILHNLNHTWTGTLKALLPLSFDQTISAVWQHRTTTPNAACDLSDLKTLFHNNHTGILFLKSR
jgi:hypothetical protein